MADRERWNLRGRVRSCTIQRTWYSLSCGTDRCDTERSGDNTTVEFRTDGALAVQLHPNPDGSEWRITYDYDDVGRISARTENTGGVFELNLYEYDPAGRLVRVVGRDSKDGDRILERFEYDAEGCKTKTLYVDVATQRPNTVYTWSVEGVDSLYSAPGTTRITTLHNQRDQPSVLLFHDATDRELSRVDFRYDEAAHLIEEVQRNSAEMLPAEMLASLNSDQLESVHELLGGHGPTCRRTYVYGGQDRRVETTSYIGQLGIDRKREIYNEHGDTTEVIQESEHRSYSWNESGQLVQSPAEKRISRARMRYDYDSHGNWISKTVETLSGTEQRSTLSSVEQRDITYFV